MYGWKWGKKGKKGKKKKPYPRGDKFVAYYPSRNTPRQSRQWLEPYLQLASLDPAEVNLAIRIERRYVVDANGQAGRSWHGNFDFPAQDQCTVYNWVVSSHYRIFIEQLHYHNHNIRGQTDSLTILNVHDTLTALLHLFRGCHVIIIERQLWHKNPPATRIFEQILRFLLVNLQDSPICPDILEIDAKWVKEMMSLTTGKKKGNKTIMPYRIRALLYFYGETNGRQILSEKGKKDDKADVVANIETICRVFPGFPSLLDPGTHLDWSSLDVIKTYTHLGVRP